MKAEVYLKANKIYIKMNSVDRQRSKDQEFTWTKDRLLHLNKLDISDDQIKNILKYSSRKPTKTFRLN